MRLAFVTLAIAVDLLASTAPAAEEAKLRESTGAALWAEFSKAPYTHPNIPNVSFAGYRFGEQSLPEPKIAANVRDLGAKGDGKADDSAAFAAAVDKAGAAADASGGAGAVLVPAGEYKLSNPVWLGKSGLVLRGQGPDKTVLAFTQPVSKAVPGVSGSWFGGMVWIGLRKPQPEINPSLLESVDVVKPARWGEFSVEVAAEDARKLASLVGKTVQVTWIGDLSLCHYIAGHDSMKACDWSSWGAFRGGKLTWHWANQIEKVAGATVTFKKPLRLEVREGWQVKIGVVSPWITDAGVEHLTIRFPMTQKAPHLREPGYNGVLLHQAAHCFARDVVMENVDVGVNMSDNTVNCTATGFVLRGRPNHHATAMRNLSHDNLLQDFRIESKPHHGLNTEGISSGNVWRNGEMKDGTFDSHCMMSFDSVRTNITVNNTGGPGGAGNHGPFVGRRMTHWNIRVTNGRGEWVAQPAILPSGAVVGIQGGASLELKAAKLWHLPDGLDKGCVVGDVGKAPVPADLFEAQLRLRLGN
jgi:hypothetical protein